MGSYHLGTVVRLWGVIGGNQTALKAALAAGATAIAVYDIAGYTNADPIVINPGGVTEEFASISGSPAGTSIPLATSLLHGHGIGEVVQETASPTVVLTVKLPDGTTSTPAVNAVTGKVGMFEAFYSTTQSGRHVYEFAASVAVTAKAEGTFWVLASEI